jgi:hypothetical protein
VQHLAHFLAQRFDFDLNCRELSRKVIQDIDSNASNEELSDGRPLRCGHFFASGVLTLSLSFRRTFFASGARPCFKFGVGESRLPLSNVLMTSATDALLGTAAV